MTSQSGPAEAPLVDCRGARKTGRDDDARTPRLEHRSSAAGERWVIRSFAAARTVLRAEGSVEQAGFLPDGVEIPDRIRPPILYQEGAEHRSQRSATARYFAPKVTKGYQEMMERLADRLVARLDRGRPVAVSELSLRMAVEVAARVLGLTNSPPGLSRRLEALFRSGGNPPGVERGRLSRIRTSVQALAPMVFFFLDVKPAIRARRRRPAEDVISELIGRDFADADILTEAITFGAAGMVTTREFISVAAWHLLDDDDLRARYRAGTETERAAILAEILRLEPVVGHLYRRLTAPLTVTDGADPVEIPAGALVDLDIRAVNADADLLGEEPLRLVVPRDLPRGVPDAVMSFGDGNHRCPGNAIALLESDVFLTRLLAQDLVVVSPPELTWNFMIESYELRGFVVRRR